MARRIPRIFLDANLEVGARIPLPEPALQHVVKVLRLHDGDRVSLFDGHGGEYPAVLAQVTRRSALARIVDHYPSESESPLRLTLAQGVSRGERMDYTLQKAVELGVVRIIPVLTARSVVRLSPERWQRRLAHWQGVIAAACEQCGRNRLPELTQVLPLPLLLAAPAGSDCRLVLDPEAPVGLRELAAPAGALELLVGPEGGLEEAELASAREAGFRGLSLGPRILRTETAGVAALAGLQCLWGDMG